MGVNRVENVEYVDWGAGGGGLDRIARIWGRRPTCPTRPICPTRPVPCRLHGYWPWRSGERGEGFRQDLQDWGAASELSHPHDYDGREKSIR